MRAMTRRLSILAFVLLLLPAAAAGQQSTKQQKKQQEADMKAATDAQNAPPLITPPDDQAVDTAITEWLGAWQIGNVDMMKKYMADNILVVSGLWEPPLTGLDKYLAAYQRQRERVHGVQLNRSNTFIRVQGNVAWAIYQWTFTGEVDGRPTGYRGHTTLVFEKRNGTWQIITNHTSLADAPPEPVAPQANPQPQPQPQAPAKPQ
jgi:ketosteroid isomerase-like protein